MINNNVLEIADSIIEGKRSMDFLNRVTPFSGWYKGEHGKTRNGLKKSVRTLIHFLKGKKEYNDVKLCGSLRVFLETLNNKNESWDDFFNALDEYKKNAMVSS